MGWLTIMTDTTAWTPEQHTIATDAIELYKKQLRPLIRDGSLYHVSARPDGIHWDGIEYWDPARRKGVVFAFRGKTGDEERHSFVLDGLDAGKRYRLHFQDGSAPDSTQVGAQLMQRGVEVHLRTPLSSELVFIEEAEGSKHGQ